MPQRLRAPDGRDLHLLGTVHGLLSEAERVRRGLAVAKPAAVALGVSPESAAALERHVESPADDVLDEMPDHDLVYRHVLGRYGDVRLPPPDLLAAVREGRSRGATVEGVDLTEEQYSDAFAQTVSTLQFLKLGRIQRRLSKRPPEEPDARTFALAWDAQLRRVKGLDAMERLREQTIARNAHDLLSRTGGPVLLLVEWPRLDGVAAALRERGFR